MLTPAPRAFINHVLIYSLVAIGSSGLVGLGSVWARHQISLAADANRGIENRIAEIERRSEEIRTAMAEEQDVGVLLRRNDEWKLGLVPPRQEQVQAVGEDPMMRLAAKRDRDLFKPGLELSRPISAFGRSPARPVRSPRAKLGALPATPYRIAWQP